MSRSNERRDFKADRRFGLREVFDWPETQFQIKLIHFDDVDDRGELRQNVALEREMLDVIEGGGICTPSKT
ncbi:MAG: hypothetical protein JSS27_16875 [Planctomycetes bacterium]|nr:hypothetical protein [Planctomycetota bacterium]